MARWQASLETGGCSPLEFYCRVENSLTECGLPDLRFSRITRSESGWFSPKRVYLRVRCQRLYFDVSAFVVGGSLIAGWWLHKDAPGVLDLMAEIPGFGLLLEKTTRSATYFQVDYIEYVERVIHASILRILDELSEETGVALLPAEARVPVWEEIW